MTTLRAGAASADITPAPGGLMDGYGNRLSPSRGVHDPLSARVLVLDYGDAACAIVVCDLLGVHPSLTADVRRCAKETVGIPEDNVIVAATHNHAGPAGLRSGMFSRLDDALVGGYESGVTFFTGEAEAIIRERSIELLREVFRDGG